jgi:cytochrome c biogenesis factor
MLYLGYVGLTVPFACALGALLRTAGRTLAHRYATLDGSSLDALGIGQLLGAHWAYVEGRVGQAYAWDRSRMRR